MWAARSPITLDMQTLGLCITCVRNLFHTESQTLPTTSRRSEMLYFLVMGSLYTTLRFVKIHARIKNTE